MTQQVSFQTLLAKMRDGDRDAAGELWRGFEPAIRRSVRFQLRRHGLQQRDYSDERVQSVALLFFDRLNRGKLDELLDNLDDPDQLLSLFRKMAQGKVVDWIRRQSAERRDERKKRSIEAGAIDPRTYDTSPSEDIIHREQLQRGIGLLTDEEQRIAEMVRLGRPWQEIADECGRSLDAVQKKFYRSVTRLKQELRSESP